MFVFFTNRDRGNCLQAQGSSMPASMDVRPWTMNLKRVEVVPGFGWDKSFGKLEGTVFDLWCQLDNCGAAGPPPPHREAGGDGHPDRTRDVCRAPPTLRLQRVPGKNMQARTCPETREEPPGRLRRSRPQGCNSWDLDRLRSHQLERDNPGSKPSPDQSCSDPAQEG